ncbi:MAG: ATP-binding protein [Tepidisphaeraceae bacterium]|jgi:signal transduction histidine kinase
MTEAGQRHPLAPHLAWFIHLRWITGVVVTVSGAANWLAFRWHPDAGLILAVGLGILVYNALLWRSLQKSLRSDRPRLLRLAVAQMLLDLVCLALLVAWTGGLRSPILGFFVFHMVFASLLLPRVLAYSSALTAIAFLVISLAQSGQLPDNRGDAMILVGMGLTFLLTVSLTNHITRDLRRQRRRLVRQNRRIRRMARHLRLQQRTMVRQEKMVALGQMVAGVAHEIANPLASMDSLLQLAQRKSERLTPETIGKLRDQVARIHATINQMRSMVHPTGGGEQPAPLNDVVAQAVEMVRLDPRARRLGIQKILGPEVASALVRPQALQQVVINLLLNSLDAIAEVPEPKLIIQTRLGERGYAVDVIDNGCGIKPEHLNRLFEPFFTTKPVGKGTGLGLSISYSLIQRQGGWIDVQSQLGMGTTMTVHLPAPAAAVVNNAAI